MSASTAPAAPAISAAEEAAVLDLAAGASFVGAGGGLVVLWVGAACTALVRLLEERYGIAALHELPFPPADDGAAPELGSLGETRFDLVVSVGALGRIAPTALDLLLESLYERVRAGGYVLLSAASFLSRRGAGVETPLTTPLAHILFPRRIIEQHLAGRGMPQARYASPLCGASYVTLFRRAGFELLDARRVGDELDAAVYERFADKLDVYDRRELREPVLTALLQRPEAPEPPPPTKPAPAKPAPTSAAPLEREKTRLEWGDEQARSLWSNLYARYDPVVDGQTVLDIGCSWGYLLRFLAEEFRPRRLIGVDISQLWETVDHGWDYRAIENLEFHAGDLGQIEALEPESVDLVLCTSVLQYMTPEQLEANLERVYSLLRPGGQMILRTRVWTSYIGADLHSYFELPYVHLLYARAELARAVREQYGRELRYLNWLTASSYLAIFNRVGFEILDAPRRMNRAAPEVGERVGAAYPWIAPDELGVAELEAKLVRPIEPEELYTLAAPTSTIRPPVPGS
jgi:cyclopropane fatty-acyl-phospholipid synthase-like methyltransferase